MSVLSAKKKHEIVSNNNIPLAFIEMVEVAVLEAQKKEPIYCTPTEHEGRLVYEHADAPIPNADCFVLYAAPVVKPGMVLVPREPTLAMLDCLRADTTPNLEKRYKNMIDAAEGKK